MNVDISQLSGLFNPESSFIGQSDKMATSNAAREQMLSKAAQMRQAATRSAQMLPEDVSKAQYENSPAVRSAAMAREQSTTDYNAANTAAVWHKLDADTQKQAVQGVLEGHMNLAKQGEIIATQGGNGQTAYEQMKQMLMGQMQEARTPKQKQQAQKALTDLDQQAKVTGMLSWDSTLLLTESQKMINTLMEQDPTVIMENLKGAWDVKKAGVGAGATVEAARIGAESREGIAAGKQEKPPNTAEAAEVRDIARREAAGDITSEQAQTARADIMAAKQNPNRSPGMGLVPGAGGKVEFGSIPKVPAYVSPVGKGPAETKVIGGATYVKVPGGWKKQ